MVQVKDLRVTFVNRRSFCIMTNGMKVLMSGIEDGCMRMILFYCAEKYMIKLRGEE